MKVSAQQWMRIEGWLYNQETKEPLAYASIYNKSTQKGTLTNLDGFFAINISNPSDTIQVSFVGYKTLARLELHVGQTSYKIYLEENKQLLSEVVVRPNDNSYLFDLIAQCKKKATKTKAKSKAYYELKSYRNDTQVELVEAFYNLDLEGYELKDMTMKTGRLALQPYHERLFGSMESSRAITMFKLLKSNNYFPTNPMELSSKELRKHFYLRLDKKYLNETSDSVYVLTFEPKQDKSNFFEGTVWIDKSNLRFIKVNLLCDSTSKHPFMPLFPNDQIESVSFDITQTFVTAKSSTFFNHIDFIYSINYKSRQGEEHEQAYSVTTKAVLHAYDFDKLFFEPTFDRRQKNIGDYRKINAMPYNDFFWQSNNEFRLGGSEHANEKFYSDTISITNKSIFSANATLGSKLFHHPYAVWSSEKRISLREIKSDTTRNSRDIRTAQERYNLDVELYLDVNYYGDSMQIITATVFDPYDSFYDLPMDNKTVCFINLFFDLCEIERRKFHEGLTKQRLSEAAIMDKYKAFLVTYKQQQYTYIKLLDRGTNEKEMKKWSAYVYEQLGMDNIAMFNPYENAK